MQFNFYFLILTLMQYDVSSHLTIMMQLLLCCTAVSNIQSTVTLEEYYCVCVMASD